LTLSDPKMSTEFIVMWLIVAKSVVLWRIVVLFSYPQAFWLL